VEDVPRIVLAMEQHDVAEEVMHFLDRTGRARIVATAADDRQLLEAVRQLEPDAVIAQPSIVVEEAVRSRVFLALDTLESIVSLRAAIRVGADGFFLWPADREALSDAVAAATAAPAPLERRATVVAVHAARGGADATSVATHLARAFARRGRACILVDGDAIAGEVGAALGAPEDGVHSLGDLLPLLGELSPGHLDDTLWTHPEGFRVLLAPREVDASWEPSALRRIVEVTAAMADVVVVRLPVPVDAAVRETLGTTDRVLEVLSLDVLSFRAARRALDGLRAAGGEVGFVVNRASRSEITPGDVERVFGCQPLAVVPFDRSLSTAQDHGRLVSPRGRAGRALDRLAARVEEGVS
jgi:Flp pilus assembly CpaE family ATPase